MFKLLYNQVADNLRILHEYGWVKVKSSLAYEKERNVDGFIKTDVMDENILRFILPANPKNLRGILEHTMVWGSTPLPSDPVELRNLGEILEDIDKGEIPSRAECYWALKAFRFMYGWTNDMLVREMELNTTSDRALQGTKEYLRTSLLAGALERRPDAWLKKK
ncbi:hypothetical protein BACPU_26260 [Bacillus pumilus]|nr:hypothetical protein BACPU_26260 [Bacillus pumilus]